MLIRSKLSISISLFRYRINQLLTATSLANFKINIRGTTISGPTYKYISIQSGHFIAVCYIFFSNFFIHNKAYSYRHIFKLCSDDSTWTLKMQAQYK